MNSYSKTYLKILVAILFIAGILQSKPVIAAETGHDPAKLDVGAVILHHVMDDYSWHFFDGHYGTLYLPVIVYTADRSLEVFSSANFYNDHHESVAYNGYQLEHNHIVRTDGTSVMDFSITKNVAMLLLTAFVLVVTMTSVASKYKKNKGNAPKGLQNFFEIIVLFVRDEIVKPNIGPRYQRYLPYMLTLFFFILIGNILGLLPGAANLTGNIAVTAVLALITFIMTNISGNRNYWSHIFWTPGVPFLLRFVILPVEILGIFTKPFSLTLRLFVAITAGHIVLLSLICLAFIFQSITVGFVSSIIVLFINLIEILVAGIQAYVFTLFSSLYIGMAVEEHHDDHH